MAGKQIITHHKVRKLQRTLYQQAKCKLHWKAWSLYADLCQKEFIEEAMSRILNNQGGSGIDGYTVETMEEEWETFRDNLQQELLEKTFHPSPVKSVTIPKANADDFVILVKRGLEGLMLDRVKVWLTKAGLELSLSKRKITDTSDADNRK